LVAKAEFLPRRRRFFEVVTTRTHRHTWAWFLVSFLLGHTFAVVSPADAADITYRHTVSEVRLTFFATDEHNRNIDTLGKSDFAVVDNELIVRDFRSFSRCDNVGLDVAVLVDSSDSVAAQFRQEIGNVLQLLSQAHWLPDDRVSVISFSGLQPKVVCAGDCRGSSAADRLFSGPHGGMTPLYDAVVFSSDFISRRREPGVRPVLILFSDGIDTISKNSAEDAFQSALASDAQIYAVDLNNSKSPSQGAAFLQRIAGATGGRYFNIRNGATQLLGAVLDDLHAAYVVTYGLPSREAGLHSVRILPTHNLNLRFRSRQGYYQGAIH
jgi:VWFA-related protein